MALLLRIQRVCGALFEPKCCLIIPKASEVIRSSISPLEGKQFLQQLRERRYHQYRFFLESPGVLHIGDGGFFIERKVVKAR